MRSIAIRKDFGVSDISDEEDVQTILEKIKIESNVDVQLDLSGCLIDYPATSRLMDTILKQLSLLSGKKTLKIITDYVLPMPTVLNWIFLGSGQMDLQEKKGLPKDDIVKIIGAALQRSEIILKITIMNDKGNVINELAIPTEQS